MPSWVMPTDNELVDFAKRVEDLCDFLLAQVKKDGSHDVVIVQNLKEEAANIQTQIEIGISNTLSLQGLDDFIRGLPPKEQ